VAFIAGKYDVTYNGAEVGQIQEGITIEHQHFGQIITGDNLADGPQDMVFRGTAVFVQFNLIEWDQALASAIFSPWGSAYLTQSIKVGNLASDNWKVLELTALEGTPANSTTPKTITFDSAILAENFPVSVLFAPALRTVPIRMRVFPDSTTDYGTANYGTLT